ncbi:MAG TPA: hypothetical protein VF765_26195 [Polyangiaceae bacterium]
MDPTGQAQPPGNWGGDGGVDSPVTGGDDASTDHATPADAPAEATNADVTIDVIDDVAQDVVQQDITSEPSPVCTPGDSQCSGNGVQTCDASGQWGAVSPCSGQTCVNGACQGVCGPTDTQVVPCGNCGQETDTCGSDGNWVQGTCGGKGVCSPGDLQCGGSGGNQPQVCSTACKWANNGPACMATNPCMNGQCVCGTGTCTGCCASDNTCQAGTANNVCGVAGVPCQDCTGSGQHCTGSGFCN